MLLLRPRLIVIFSWQFLLEFTVQDDNSIFTGTSDKTSNSNYVLHIKKNMYGLCQAWNNWFDAFAHRQSPLGSLKVFMIPVCLYAKTASFSSMLMTV
jgi:hypothetical protein